MKSFRVHLTNKYPSARVTCTGNSISVHNSAGRLLVEVQKDAHGGWNDNQHESGARDAFCLAPIPKKARAMKLFDDGSLAPSEEYNDRIKVANILAKENGMVPSIDTLKKAKNVEHLIESEK